MQRRILFVITKGSWGGAQRYVFDLATHAAHSYDVVVACGEPGELVDRLQSYKVATHTIASFSRDIALFKDIRGFWEIMRLIRHRRPDVVHANSSKAGLIATLAARLCGVRTVIYTVHGFPFFEKRNTWVRTILYAATWVTVQCATHIICICESDRQVALRMWGIRRKITFIRNGIACEARVERSEARARMRMLIPDISISDETLLVATGTELTHNKNIATVIDAFVNVSVHVPSATLVIFGRGELEASLKARASTCNNRIIFAGFMNDLASLLPAFDLFVLASWKEGLPYVLLECGCAGIPVVASRVGGIPDIIPRDAPSHTLIDPNNGEALARAIHHMLTHADARAHAAAALAARVKKYFSPEEMRRATLALYARPDTSTETDSVSASRSTTLP